MMGRTGERLLNQVVKIPFPVKGPSDVMPSSDDAMRGINII